MKQMREFSLRTILELACSAQRQLGRYIKEHEIWLGTLDPKVPPKELPNKLLIQMTLGTLIWDDRMPPKNLVIKDEDRIMADNIEKYYRRLAFSVIANDNSFESTVFSLLNSDKILENNIGFIACLPSKYETDLARNKVKKHSRVCDTGFVGEIDTWIADCDTEILEVSKSKNYDAFNITAIVNNKMCSWMTRYMLNVGCAVIIKAKIKGHSKHWLFGNDVTRLNYVKAAQ